MFANKNFSFRLKKEGKWELSPAYDLCYAYSPDNRWINQHALSMNGKRKDISREDLLSVEKTIKSKKTVSILNEISANVSQWKKFANNVNVFPELRDRIDKTLVIL